MSAALEVAYGLTVDSAWSLDRQQVVCQLPDGIDSGTFMPMLREKHGVVVKRVDAKFFNGIRLSAHIFNTEAEIDRALKVIREELA